MKIFRYICIIFLMHFEVYSKKKIICPKKQTITEISALEFAQKNIYTKLIQCTNNYPFNFKSYPLYSEYAEQKFPHQGLFQNIYIISIPKGTAQFHNGYTFLNNYFIKECQIKDISLFNSDRNIIVEESKNKYSIKGTLAICEHLFPHIYGHFMLDVLSQLALLEIFNIQYDYLCIPYHAQYMKEALELWGIDHKKIIPLKNQIIKADAIVLPTSTTQTQTYVSNANYTNDFLIKYVRQKLLDGALKKNIDFTSSNKIFISRKDGNKRHIANEDEIFNLFKKYGFIRYELTKLSLTEQILLFHNANIIVSFIGSGSLNIIFSKQNTKYIEIIQSMVDATFFFLADVFKLDYNFIDATKSCVLDIYASDKEFPLFLVQSFLEKNINL